MKSSREHIFVKAADEWLNRVAGSMLIIFMLIIPTAPRSINGDLAANTIILKFGLLCHATLVNALVEFPNDDAW